MKRMVFGLFLLAATNLLAAAQLYRWVDDKGNVEYRDTPPPKDAKKVEQRNVTTSTIQTSTPSYSAQMAAKNFPVTLWAFDCGDPCKNARALLARRGVPYTEKNPQDDLKAFEKLTGSNNAPVLFVGSTKLTGFLESQWDEALDIAGYPRSAPAGAAKPPATPAPKPAAAQKPAPPAGEPGGAATPGAPAAAAEPTAAASPPASK
jgi:glutaredoxin